MNKPGTPIIAIHRRGGGILGKEHSRCPALPRERACRVKMLQQRLRAFGLYHGCQNGCYGPRTQKAVLQFQEWARLPMSGKLDAATWRALFGPQARLSSQYMVFARSLCLQTPCMQGLDVWAVQQKLARQGFLGDAPDGCYGPKTCSAVRTFQAAVQIEADGVVGPETWNALF